MSEEHLWGLRPQPDDTSAFEIASRELAGVAFATPKPQPDDTSAFEIASRQVRRCDRVLLWAYVIFGVVVMALGLFAILTQ